MNITHKQGLSFANKLFKNVILTRNCVDPTWHLTVLPNHARPASHSSHSWLERQRKDVYKKMARYDHYRARSAYKLIQIDDKYKFLKPGTVVIEAGAAPGSWTQVICERLKLTHDSTQNITAESGLCIAVDISGFEPVEGALCLSNADITSPFTQGKILTWLDTRKVDCVLSDMAPASTGHKFVDHDRVIKLVKCIIPFTLQVLRPGTGVLLFKLWDGCETSTLVQWLKENFDHVNYVKPDASRGDSAELYIMCRKFKGIEEARLGDSVKRLLSIGSNKIN